MQWTSEIVSSELLQCTVHYRLVFRTHPRHRYDFRLGREDPFCRRFFGL
jgi:hypothetical protein